MMHISMDDPVLISLSQALRMVMMSFDFLGFSPGRRSHESKLRHFLRACHYFFSLSLPIW